MQATYRKPAVEFREPRKGDYRYGNDSDEVCQIAPASLVRTGMYRRRADDVCDTMQNAELLDMRLQRDQALARANRVQQRMENLLGQAAAADTSSAVAAATAAAAGTASAR